MQVTLTLAEENIRSHKHGYNHGCNLMMEGKLENPHSYLSDLEKKKMKHIS